MRSFEDDLTARNRLVASLVALMSAGNFDDVLRRAPESRVTAEKLRKAVDEYGRTLVPLPAESYELIDYVAVLGSSPLQWSVVVPLFTREEGRSDLSLELSIFQHENGGYNVEVDDIHVL